MMDGNIDYLWESAYIHAEKEYMEYMEWAEYQQSLQKPAKIEVKYDKIGDKSRELERVN